MRCESVKRKLSTWANEPHGDREVASIEKHVATCDDCRQFQATVTRFDHVAARIGGEVLHRDLRDSILRTKQKARTSMVRPRFAARPWVAAAAIAAMVIGARFAPKRGGAYSASAADLVRHMESAALKQGRAFHRSLWQSEGIHQQGELKLREEVWCENGSLRETATPGMGGDRLILKEGNALTYYRRETDGSMVKLPEDAVQDGDASMESLLMKAGIQNREADAEDLGLVLLDGRECEELSVPTYDDQRTLVWVLPGSDIPVRFQRDNRSRGEWHTSWVFTVEYAEHWPASTFDPATLGHPLPAVSDEVEPVIHPEPQ